MNTPNTEPNERTTSTVMGGASDPAGVAPAETGGGRVRVRLVSGWRFTRHLLEMLVAMGAGMAVLGVALGALGEPPGYANLFVRYGLMGAFMSAPMVAWIVYRWDRYAHGARAHRAQEGSSDEAADNHNRLPRTEQRS